MGTNRETALMKPSKYLNRSGLCSTSRTDQCFSLTLLSLIADAHQALHELRLHWFCDDLQHCALTDWCKNSSVFTRVFIIGEKQAPVMQFEGFNRRRKTTAEDTPVPIVGARRTMPIRVNGKTRLLHQKQLHPSEYFCHLVKTP